jgi:hypothetical protein
MGKFSNIRAIRPKLRDIGRFDHSRQMRLIEKFNKTKTLAETRPLLEEYLDRDEVDTFIAATEELALSLPRSPRAQPSLTFLEIPPHHREVGALWYHLEVAYMVTSRDFMSNPPKL